MDPIIVVIKEIKNGKIQLTEEELKGIVRRAYNEGYWEGKKNYYYSPFTYTSTTGNGPVTRDITISCDTDPSTISNTYAQMSFDDLIGDFLNN